jgi:hypothetical protein
VKAKFYRLILEPGIRVSDIQLTSSARIAHWLGHTITGVENHPAPDGGGGLECDKYSKAAIENHFNNFFGQLLPTLDSMTAKGFVGALIDSYEVGSQNWTKDFPAEFEKRKGYNLIKYLPAITGRIMGNTEVSDRFLWDVRRTQSDMMADYYFGHFSELCHKHGMKSFAEAVGGPFEEANTSRNRIIGDFAEYGKLQTIWTPASVGNFLDKNAPLKP